MRQSVGNTFDKKVKLIYEYNKTSPLFVRMASSEIQQNNIDTAISLLQEGLDIYSDNPVAYLLLGKAFALMGNYEKGLDYFKKGSELVHSSATYDYYVNELQDIKKQRSLFEATKGKSFFNPTNISSEQKTEPDLFNSSKHKTKNKETVDTIDNRLNQLVDQISKAKISTSYSNTLTDSDFEKILKKDNLIISETLAKIYTAQNEYEEAIKVYKKLIAKEPEREEHYSNMIREIKQKVNS